MSQTPGLAARPRYFRRVGGSVEVAADLTAIDAIRTFTHEPIKIVSPPPSAGLADNF